MAQDIPLLVGNPWYETTVPILDADGSTEVLTFEFRWNFRDFSWYFNLTQDDGTRLVSGVRVVLGVYLGRRSRAPFFKKGVLVAKALSDKGREATLDDFGTRVVLRRYNVYEVILGTGLGLGA